MAAIEPQALALDIGRELLDGQAVPSDPLVAEHSTIGAPWEMRIKRGVDVTISLVVLLVLAPVLLLLAVAIKLTSPGPVLFRQTHLRAYRKSLTTLMIRTMVECSGDTL